jgi:hypothetical protein
VAHASLPLFQLPTYLTPRAGIESIETLRFARQPPSYPCMDRVERLFATVAVIGFAMLTGP